MEDKKLLLEVKVYDDGTIIVNDKPLSDYLKEKIKIGLQSTSQDEEMEAPGGGEDINIFHCNNCPK